MSDFMSVGNSQISCVYDAAVILMALLDTVNLDKDCEVYKALQSCLDSLFEALPSRFVVEFGDGEASGEASGAAGASGGRAGAEG